MSKPAAIDAQCVDIQNDRQHKGFIKVTLHVPAERGQLLTNAMGWPTFTDPVPVAIARLNFTPQPTEEEDRTFPTKELSPPADTRPAGPNRLAQHIAILCNDIRFQRFVGEWCNCSMDAEQVAQWVRWKCDVDSRADILPGTKAEQAWNLIESAYLAETRI